MAKATSLPVAIKITSKAFFTSLTIYAPFLTSSIDENSKVGRQNFERIKPTL